MLIQDKKQSFWVSEGGKPQLIEGTLIPEEEGDWCAGALRLHTDDGRYYPHYFKTEKELLDFEIEMAQHSIEFETEMFQFQLEELKQKKQYWVDLLATHESKNG
jgi:hypothetical protein